MNKLMSNLRDTLTRKGDLYKDAIDSLNQKTSEQEQKSLNDDFLYETGPFNKKITVVLLSLRSGLNNLIG